MTNREYSALSRRNVLMALGVTAGLGYLLPRAGVAAEPVQGEVTALVFDSGRLLLAADGFWTSADGGATFAAAAGQPASAVTALAAHPDRPGLIYAAHVAGGLTRSDDGGRSWRDAGAGLPAAPADAVAIAAHEPDTVYVAVRGDGLWSSKDGGASWEFAMDRPFSDGVEHDVLALASVGSPSGMGGFWVFAGTGTGVTKVPDCFCRWQELGNDGAMDALAAGQDPAPKTGARLPPEPATSLVLAPSAPNVLFAALPSGIWKSGDTGESWQLIADALASPSLAVDPRDPDHIVAAASDGTILTSRDGGLTWAAPVAA